MLKAIGERRYPLMLETRCGSAIGSPYMFIESTPAERFCELMQLTQIEVDTVLAEWKHDYPGGGYHYTFSGDIDELIQVAIPATRRY